MNRDTAEFISHFLCLEISTSNLSGMLNGADGSLRGVCTDDTVPTYPRRGADAPDVLKRQVAKGSYRSPCPPQITVPPSRSPTGHLQRAT